MISIEDEIREVEIDKSIPYLKEYDQIVFEILHNLQYIYSIEKGIARYFKSSRKNALNGEKDIYHNGVFDRSDQMYEGDRDSTLNDLSQALYGRGKSKYIILYIYGVQFL